MRRPATSGNPFDGDADPDRHALWTMLVERDIDAFVAGDFERIASDFDERSFSTVNASGSADPDRWSLSLTDLGSYRDEWLRQSTTFRAEFEDPRAVLYEATELVAIEIRGDHALAHKTFDSVPLTRAGARRPLEWRTLYQCRRRRANGNDWRITGFIGFLPLAPPEMTHAPSPAIVAPPSRQHATAGAYSPVLIVRPSRLAVISGQGALDPSGAATSQALRDQVRDTLANCTHQLARSGLGLHDVFKVNAYLADIADWPEFNAAYQELMPPGRLPVRTTVGANLVPGLRVEIEMWAAE